MSKWKTFQHSCLTAVFLFMQVSSAHALAPESVFKKPPGLSLEEKCALTPRYKTAQSFFDTLETWLAQNPKAKLLTLVRHGESTSNVFQHVQTYEAYSPLTTLGVKQRNAMAKFFTERGIYFDRYIASDLERSFQTLFKLARGYGKSPEILKCLREALIWPIGGISVKLARQILPGMFRAFIRNPEHFSIPGMYSGRKVKKYLAQLINEIINSPNRKTILCSHGITILIMLMELLQINYSKYSSVYNKVGNSANLGITVLAYHPSAQTWELLVYGDNSYLNRDLRGRTTAALKKVKERVRYLVMGILRLLMKPIPCLGKEFLSDYYPNRASFIEPSSETLQELLKGVGSPQAHRSA